MKILVRSYLCSSKIKASLILEPWKGSLLDTLIELKGIRSGGESKRSVLLVGI